jgi:glycosyltransferase involved in cell wall biosynthesis
MSENSYALITTARNEGKYIDDLLISITSQTVFPVKWVIVSDGSIDNTNDLVEKYSNIYKFIELIKVQGDKERNFGSKIRAFRKGYEYLCLNTSDMYKFIGNVDADITFSNNYFEKLMSKFDCNPKLGLAGGYIYEKNKNTFVPRMYNNTRSVPHALQFFRKEVYESINGYIPLMYGGEDWYAEVNVRKIDWDVQSFPDLPAYHHRKTSSYKGLYIGIFHQGYTAYFLGSHPIFETLKNIRRSIAHPIIIGSIIRMSGYIWCYIKGEKISVEKDFVKYLREEQFNRIKKYLNFLKN